MLRHALTIFLSALMLFQVQPLVGKYILPWFGGSPAVWTTCMLLFQVLLLFGYAYAHVVSAKLSPRAQSALHLVLLAASLAWLPLAPSESWKPLGDESPTWRILALLTATIGGPYLLLSATGPLVQNWFARSFPGRSPYRLYALSNVGSLLALISYPFVLEPTLPLRQQTLVWSGGYALFVVCCAWCAIQFWRHAGSLNAVEPEIAAESAADAAPPTARQIVFWLSLAACGSVLLLATTNEMCQEVAVVPFLWVLPLAIYLMSFILTFDSDRWYERTRYGVLLGIGVIGSIVAVDSGASFDFAVGSWADSTLGSIGIETDLAGVIDFTIQSTPLLILQIMIFSATLFVATMVCHGELARSRPDPRHLTLFYLCVAAGGAAGGIAVALVAPAIFDGFWEYQLSLTGVCLLALAAYRSSLTPNVLRRNDGLLLRSGFVLAGVMVSVISLGKNVLGEYEDMRMADRNFYGVLRVHDVLLPDNKAAEYRWLAHGRIKHGMQFLDAEKRLLPTTYYAPKTGVGLAIAAKREEFAGQRGLRIGVVGLGTGTLAAYGQKDDVVRFYEINPTVADVARDYFTYLSDTPAEVDVVLGDARVQLERELQRKDPQRFDVLAIDAFSSDAIPLHLLTRECFQVYWQHLQPDGILALHISNRNVDLVPVVRGLADELGQRVVWIHSEDDAKVGASSSDWLLVARDPAVLDAEKIAKAITQWPAQMKPTIIWTDDHASLSQVLTK